VESRQCSNSPSANGPEPEVTRNVLEVLQRAGIRSTFFVLG